MEASALEVSDSSDEDVIKATTENLFNDLRKNRILKNNIQHKKYELSMINVLVICTLALQYLGEIIMPGDVIKWTQEGKLPYLYGIKLLPKHMKLTKWDLSTFSPKAPSYKQLVKNVRIAELELLSSLPDCDVILVCSRYLHELNLPLSLLPVIRCLSESAIYSRSICHHSKRNEDNLKYLYLPDLYGMALILVAIKLVFGINDSVKFEHFDICPEHINNTCTIFSYTKWMTKRKSNLGKQLIYKENFNEKMVGKVASTAKYFLEIPAMKTSISTDLFPSNKFKKLHQMRHKFGFIYGGLVEFEEVSANKTEKTGSQNEIEEINFKYSCIIPHLKQLSKTTSYNLFSKWNSYIEWGRTSYCEFDSFSECYKFWLNIACEITNAPADYIHEMVVFVEKYGLTPFSFK